MTFSQILDEYLELRDVHKFYSTREPHDSLVSIDRHNKMALLRKHLDDAVAVMNDGLIAIDNIVLPEAKEESKEEPKVEAPKPLKLKALAKELVRTGHAGIHFEFEAGMETRGHATSMNKKHAKVRWRLRKEDDFIMLVVNSQPRGYVQTVNEVTRLMNTSVFKT